MIWFDMVIWEAANRIDGFRLLYKKVKETLNVHEDIHA